MRLWRELYRLGYLQAVKFENNFFTLLGLPQQFEVDQQLLKKRARELQRQYHPDRFTNATPQEQRLAAQFSAQVNTASSVLANPVQRALHLLELHNIAADAQNHTEKDSSFLMQQLELRETLEENRMARDVPALQVLAQSVDAAYRDAQQDFSVTPIGEGAATNADSFDRPALLGLVSKMRFFEKLNDEVSAALNLLQ